MLDWMIGERKKGIVDSLEDNAGNARLPPEQRPGGNVQLL
jgi:hypothetical protein